MCDGPKIGVYSIRKSSRFLVFIFLVLSIIPLCSCSNAAFKTGLKDYLSAILDKNAATYNQEIAAYSGQLQQSGPLTERKAALEKALSYCWRENQGNLYFSDPYDFCTRPPGPKDRFHSGTGYYVTDEYDRFEGELNDVKEKLRILDSLQPLIQADEKSIEAMDALKSSLDKNYNDWDVKTISTGI